MVGENGVTEDVQKPNPVSPGSKDSAFMNPVFTVTLNSIIPADNQKHLHACLSVIFPKGRLYNFSISEVGHPARGISSAQNIISPGFLLEQLGSVSE